MPIATLEPEQMITCMCFKGYPHSAICDPVTYYAVPSYQRAAAVTGAADQAEVLIDGDGDDAWVAPERSGGAGPSADDDDIPTIGEDMKADEEVRLQLAGEVVHVTATAV